MDEKEQMHEKPLLWSRSEAAVQLGISGRKVDELIKEGTLPSMSIGRRVLVPRQAVLDWVEAQTRYNPRCVESVLSHTGESLCDSINVTASTTLPSSQTMENRLDVLLKPVKSE